MRWFVVNETHRDYVADHFFILGGPVLSDDQILAVDRLVTQVRLEAGYLPGDGFEFETRARRAQVSVAQSAKAKAPRHTSCLTPSADPKACGCRSTACF